MFVELNVKLHIYCSTVSKHTYLLTYLLTYSMVQSRSWEANWFQASQEIPRILWNPKVHYRTHKRPPPVPVLGQPNPVHIPTSLLLEIHPNIIHPSTPRSPQWSLCLRFPHSYDIKIKKYTSVYERVLYTTHTSLMFRTAMWPSSGWRLAMFRYIEIL